MDRSRRPSTAFQMGLGWIVLWLFIGADPCATAEVLNQLLANPGLRNELGSPRSEEAINSVLASKVERTSPA